MGDRSEDSRSPGGPEGGEEEAPRVLQSVHAMSPSPSPSLSSSASSSPSRGRAQEEDYGSGSAAGWETPGGTADDEAEEENDGGRHRQQYVDLSEEMEDDLANNNDPNNNASAGGGPPMRDANLAPEASSSGAGGGPQQQQIRPLAPDEAEALAVAAGVGGGGGGNAAALEEANQFVLEQMRELARGDEERREELRRELEDNARLILKLMPGKSFDEVYHYLEAHYDKPHRVQIVLNEFLENGGGGGGGADSNAPDVIESKDEDGAAEGGSNGDEDDKKKGKAGNGMKSKNSKKKRPAAEADGNGEVKKKRPLLDLNLETHERLKKELESDSDDEDNPKDEGKKGKRKGKGVGKGKGRSSRQEDRSGGLELSEDLIYGPFDFGAHRPKAGKSSSKKNEGKGLAAVREDLKDVLTAMEGGAKSDNKVPEVVDLLQDDVPRGPPPVVDLSKPDQGEKAELLQSFRNMFPDTPVEFLEEQAEELAGKPAATDRFITELLSRDCKPPEYWTPGGNKAVTLIEAQQQQQLHSLSDSSPQPMEVDVEEGPQPLMVPDKEVIAVPNEPPADAIVGQNGGGLGDAAARDISAPEAQQQNGVAAAAAGGGPAGEPQQIPPPPQQQQDSEEDKIQSKSSTLQILFPQADPEFLHQKVVELIADEAAFNRWVDESLETKGSEFPSRSDYEKRQEEAELMQKYSEELTAEQILDMYDDPVEYFSDTSRKASDLYKRHAVQQLKKVYRTLQANAINKAFVESKCLYYPTYKSLKTLEKKKGSAHTRKTKRPDHECLLPTEIDINFLKEMQFARIEADVEAHRKAQQETRDKKLAKAKKKGRLIECVCCYNDECLPEDMLPCKGGHMFCKECVQRASEVAIGEGKTGLVCLGQCDSNFELSTLQRALKANVFSKWLRKIQLAEVEKAEVDGLERCPFCEFATIMDTSPEENKVLQCQNPDCGKETCRLCKEISHIPLRCEEVEKDAEVRKRTYIENKMTEALIRNCWKCKKPFLKSDGCNKMTCECGAQMCYLCRKPVRDYNHFYGQGGVPTQQQTCPLWSDNKTLHEADVARGALKAKNEMDEKVPEVKLKHDPTAGVDVRRVAGEEEQKRQQEKLLAGEVPPGLEAILGENQEDRERFIREQQQIEAMIRRGGGAGNAVAGGRGPVIGPMGPGGPANPFIRPWDLGAWQQQQLQQQQQQQLVPEIHREWHEGFVNRMGELLQLREAQRRRHRMIRQREMQALEEFQQQQLNGGPQAAAGPATAAAAAGRVPPPAHAANGPAVNRAGGIPVPLPQPAVPAQQQQQQQQPPNPFAGAAAPQPAAAAAPRIRNNPLAAPRNAPLPPPPPFAPVNQGMWHQRNVPLPPPAAAAAAAPLVAMNQLPNIAAPAAEQRREADLRAPVMPPAAHGRQRAQPFGPYGPIGGHWQFPVAAAGAQVPVAGAQGGNKAQPDAARVNPPAAAVPAPAQQAPAAPRRNPGRNNALGDLPNVDDGNLQELLDSL